MRKIQRKMYDCRAIFVDSRTTFARALHELSFGANGFEVKVYLVVLEKLDHIMMETIIQDWICSWSLCAASVVSTISTVSIQKRPSSVSKTVFRSSGFVPSATAKLTLFTYHSNLLRRIFITHLHGDHCFGLGSAVLLIDVAKSKRGDPNRMQTHVYGPPGVAVSRIGLGTVGSHGISG